MTAHLEATTKSLSSVNLFRINSVGEAPPVAGPSLALVIGTFAKVANKSARLSSPGLLWLLSTQVSLR
jgi:hypothetical protein